MQGQNALDRMGEARAVVDDEGVTVATEDKGYVERLSIGEGLLHATADRVVVVLGFDHGDGQVGLVEQQIVGAFALAAHCELATHDDAASSETELTPDLRGHVPPRGHNGRSDALVTDVGLGERLFAHGVRPSWP